MKPKSRTQLGLVRSVLPAALLLCCVFFSGCGTQASVTPEAPREMAAPQQTAIPRTEMETGAPQAAVLPEERSEIGEIYGLQVLKPESVLSLSVCAEGTDGEWTEIGGTAEGAYPGGKILRLTVPAEPGNIFLILVQKDEEDPSFENQAYLDQVIAEGNTYAFSLYPILEPGDYYVFLYNNEISGKEELLTFSYR